MIKRCKNRDFDEIGSFGYPYNKHLLFVFDWKSSGVHSKFGLIYVLTTWQYHSREHGVCSGDIRNPNKILVKILKGKDNF
jgi:hypothetical protein